MTRKEKVKFDLLDAKEQRAFEKVEKIVREKKADRLGKILEDFAGGKDIIDELADED